MSEERDLAIARAVVDMAWRTWRGEGRQADGTVSVDLRELIADVDRQFAGEGAVHGSAPIPLARRDVGGRGMSCPGCGCRLLPVCPDCGYEMDGLEDIAAARLDAARKVRDRIVAHVTQPRRRVGDDAHMHMCQLVSEVQAMDDAALAKIVGE